MTKDEALERSVTGFIWTRDGVPAVVIKGEVFDLAGHSISPLGDWYPLAPHLRDKASPQSKLYEHQELKVVQRAATR